MSQPRFTLSEYRDDFGSRYLAGHLSKDSVLELAGLKLETIYRRVILDPVRGLVMLMTPSQPHEDAGVGVNLVVGAAGELMRAYVEEARGLRWRPPGENPNTGPEANCSYYIGARANAYGKACRAGQGAEYAQSHPPDLVLEVGVTPFDHAKKVLYRDLGVSEYWQAKARKGKRRGDLEMQFHSLQDADDGPENPLDASQVLPGLTPKAVRAALRAWANAPSQAALRRSAIARALQEQGFPPEAE